MNTGILSRTFASTLLISATLAAPVALLPVRAQTNDAPASLKIAPLKYEERTPGQRLDGAGH
ncbi:MAG: hypothetical protein WDM80_05100 [Limisphaerales bacterium]